MLYIVLFIQYYILIIFVSFSFHSPIFLIAPVVAPILANHEDKNNNITKNVAILYYVNDPKWGKFYNGYQSCDIVSCQWKSSMNITELMEYAQFRRSVGDITLTLYNAHTLWEECSVGYKPYCQLNTDLTMSESGESYYRFKIFFHRKLHRFRYFDGYSLTHPNSNVQQLYSDVYLNQSKFIPLKPTNKLVQGAAYVASDCHNIFNFRHRFIAEVKLTGFRVDGLGKCHATKVGKEGLKLSKLPQDRYNHEMKRKVISNYMFVFAFENTEEPGYVTEKVFDVLLSGSVPIYYGDAEHCRTLLPQSNAAIFIADFHDNVTALVNYLYYLMSNFTAYEEHRSWRTTFQSNYYLHKTIMRDSFPCKFCKWAINQPQIINDFRISNYTRDCVPASTKALAGIPRWQS